MTTDKTHCGRCSQCLDRRFGVLSAWLGEFDPPNSYGVDLLIGARTSGLAKVMADSFVRHARALTAMNDLDFLGKFGGHLARSAFAFDGISADDVTRRAIDLHRRHGQAVVGVLDAAYRRYSKELADGTLPTDCLLRMVAGHVPSVKPQPCRAPTRTGIPSERARSSQIMLGLDRERLEVLVAGIPPIRGDGTFALIDQLVHQYVDDQKAQRRPESFRFCLTRKLTGELGVDDATLRRRVTRFRKRIADTFESKHGLSLHQEAVIESRKWRGYQLNPAVRLVAVDELRADCHEAGRYASRHSRRDPEKRQSGRV